MIELKSKKHFGINSTKVEQNYVENDKTIQRKIKEYLN